MSVADGDCERTPPQQAGPPSLAGCRLTTKPSDTACLILRRFPLAPPCCSTRARSLNGGLRPDRMASLLSVTCMSASWTLPFWEAWEEGRTQDAGRHAKTHMMQAVHYIRKSSRASRFAAITVPTEQRTRECCDATWQP